MSSERCQLTVGTIQQSADQSIFADGPHQSEPIQRENIADAKTKRQWDSTLVFFDP